MRDQQDDERPVSAEADETPRRGRHFAKPDEQDLSKDDGRSSASPAPASHDDSPKPSTGQGVPAPRETTLPDVTTTQDEESNPSSTGAVTAASVDVTGILPRGSRGAARRHRLRAIPRWARALAFVVVTGILGSSLILTNCFGLVAHVDVPDVVGQTSSDASQYLEQDGLQVTVEEQDTDNAADYGKVIATSPCQGTSVAVGSTVTVKVGKSASPTKDVPNLVGLTEDEALGKIAQTGFFVKDDVMHAYSSTVAAGKVISQGPAAGVPEKMGTKIDLVISDGPSPDSKAGGLVSEEDTRESVSIPDLSGMSYTGASQLLSGMGLIVERGTDVRTDDVTAGSIANTTPGTDQTVRVGSTVVVQVATPTNS
ncbi:MAG: PASTA domain-containing protein [Olsenella sp.]|nr:PASTA domain-containing protein [Olsenella sp.]